VSSINFTYDTCEAGGGDGKAVQNACSRTKKFANHRDYILRTFETSRQPLGTETLSPVAAGLSIEYRQRS
jgi:hypothetical protein